ncbi:RDD family protein [Candidatus Woesearchaeota archaeon]|nr:RDD family protein [Candidatus Woesearchaeota archaeon]
MKKRGNKLNLPKEKSFIAPASLIKRFISYFIDLFIINFVVVYPFGNILKKIIPETSSFAETYQYIQSNPTITTALTILSLTIGILTVAYFTFFEYLTQQTPGKMLMKQYITKERGKELRFRNYLISNLTFLPFFPFILLWIIDPVYMIMTPNNQRLMEKFTRILVVEKYYIK